MHRDSDMPARINAKNGSQSWYRDGKCHRDNDMPSFVSTSEGVKEWHQRGKLHRDGDLPAVVREDGARSWRKRGELHRDGNMPAIIYVKGTPRNEDRRINVEEDGEMEWWVNGKKTGDQDNPPPGAMFPGQQTKSAGKK